MMIPPEQAFRTVLDHIRPLATARIPIAEALGHCLAEDICADRDMPPASRSAMDGYAVDSADLASAPCELKVAGEIAAGSPPGATVSRGNCVRIFTGANVPSGADAVVMVEQTRENGGTVHILSSVPRGANIFQKGEDAGFGEVLLPRGTMLGPMQLGVCAAVGIADPLVHRRPTTSILCTGEELREAGAPVEPHEMRNSNGPALRAALKTWGFEDAGVATVRDDLQILKGEVERAAASADVVVLTGGVSAGKYDFVREAVEGVGGKVHVHGVAMKPGKPLLYAVLPGDRHVFGLPGNPLSSAVGFHEFVLPALRRLSGVEAGKCRPRVRVRLAESMASKGGRVRFALVRLAWKENGPEAVPVKTSSSADLAAGGRGDGVVVIPVGTGGLKAGEMVEFGAWRPLP